MSAIRARACGETRAATFAESGDRRSLALVGREDASSEIVAFKFLHPDCKSKQKGHFLLTRIAENVFTFGHPSVH